MSFGRRASESPPAPRPAAAPAAAAEIAARAPPPSPAPAPPGAAPGRTSRSLAELRGLCLLRIDPAAVAALPPERLGPELERLVGEIATERRVELNGREQRQLAGELVHDMLGLGPLQPLLEDDALTDIMINGPDQVFVESGGRLTLTGVRFRDAAHLANICQRIVSTVGRRVDESSPMCDARLPDGSRVNIVYPPIALNGPYVSIRKFPKRKFDLARLAAVGSFSEQVGRILEIAGRSRLNIIVSGGTGSGKTTLINAISATIDPGERVITIEDAAELQLQQTHVLRMETRPASGEGRGEVSQRQLVVNAFRMRPDRVIVGEVRAAEASDMLEAMSSGHSGGLSSVHANTARDAIARLEGMAQMGTPDAPLRTIRTKIVSAIDLIVQVERHRDGKRRVTQISDVLGLEGDVVVMNDVFRLEMEGEDADGALLTSGKVSRARPSFHDRLVYFHLDREWAAALGDAA
jgi:pilus assembly protein CpaF